jgi:hypothetical protein
MTTTVFRETLAIIQAGTPLEKATGALILLHGRGGDRGRYTGARRRVDESPPSSTGSPGAGTYVVPLFFSGVSSAERTSSFVCSQAGRSSARDG